MTWEDRLQLSSGHGATTVVKGRCGVGFDLDRLHRHAPRIAFDLPAGGRRLTQRVDGYDATIGSGRMTYRDGVDTGERPGHLVRGARAA